jgi:hypothetical protein
MAVRHGVENLIRRGNIFYCRDILGVGSTQLVEPEQALLVIIQGLVQGRTSLLRELGAVVRNSSAGQCRRQRLAR